MGKSLDVKIAEAIGKALPNEVTKLNSYSKYLQYIPYVGQALSVIMKGMSAVDAGATAYADTQTQDEGNRGVAAQRAISSALAGAQGTSQDPGQYGSGGDINRDWANTAGQIGNYLPGVEKGSSGGYNVNWSSTGNLLDVMKNPYLNKNATSQNTTDTQNTDDLLDTNVSLIDAKNKQQAQNLALLIYLAEQKRLKQNSVLTTYLRNNINDVTFQDASYKEVPNAVAW